MQPLLLALGIGIRCKSEGAGINNKDVIPGYGYTFVDTQLTAHTS